MHKRLRYINMLEHANGNVRARIYTCITLLVLLTGAITQKNPHYVKNRGTMVHLFEWKFNDIAEECERYLGPMGYAGVQVSPIQENLVVTGRPWWERYQPISYKIATRSGNERSFREMVRRCNKVGVRIYVDAVFNHMTGNRSPAVGTAGSTAIPREKLYPAVPYHLQDFNGPCGIKNYNNPVEVRNCELNGLHDLDQKKDHVRNAIIAFLNNAIDAGIAGFRIDAAKHMWPDDLRFIYNNLKDLKTEHGFTPNSRPFVYQEVIDLGGEAVKKTEYNDMAAVVEFQFGTHLGNFFRGNGALSQLVNWGEEWGLLPSRDALVMIDNHDNQRGHGAGGRSILTYKFPKRYKMAMAFMLAHPYGMPRVMSSFVFDNTDAGPPTDSSENIVSPVRYPNGTCSNEWVCEHRWRQISGMVAFRNAVKNTKIKNWWTNGNNQIAFSRESLGFVAFNGESVDLQEILTTGLPAGQYCDVISGELSATGFCTGKTVIVNEDGKAYVEILRNEEDGVLAIHGNVSVDRGHFRALERYLAWGSGGFQESKLS